MNQLMDKEIVTLRLIMNAYEDVLDTVDLMPPRIIVFEHLYVPSIFDVISEVPAPSTEQALDELIRIIDKHKIFFRHHKLFKHVPLEEVW
jgi:hypothetical protein